MIKRYLIAVLLLGTQSALAGEALIVKEQSIRDEKAVFATVESQRVVPARARIGGTIATLTIKEGDFVKEGAVIATIADEKLALQLKSLDADISGLQSSLSQAKQDLARGESLTRSGTMTRSKLEQLTTAVNVADAALKARSASRAVLLQQLQEGAVLSPADGRVLSVPVTAGSVIMGGEPLAMVADDNLVLRIKIPEEQARRLKIGDPVRLAGDEIGQAGMLTGRISLIYPQIRDGRVMADAKIDGLTGSFVGSRVRVWINVGERRTILIPQSLLKTRYGIDYIAILSKNGQPVDVPVQRGQGFDTGEHAGQVEILSGLSVGEHVVTP